MKIEVHICFLAGKKYLLEVVPTSNKCVKTNNLLKNIFGYFTENNSGQESLN